MTIAAVRVAMSTALATITGLNASPYLKDSVEAPEAQIDFGIDDYDLTLGGGKHEYQFRVHVFSQRTEERESQELLDRLRDPSSSTSIKNVLQSNAGLAAVVDYCQVQSVTPPSEVEVGGADIYS